MVTSCYFQLRIRSTFQHERFTCKQKIAKSLDLSIFWLTYCNFWLQIRGHLLYIAWLLDHLCVDANSSFHKFSCLDIKHLSLFLFNRILLHVQIFFLCLKATKSVFCTFRETLLAFCRTDRYFMSILTSLIGFLIEVLKFLIK